MKRRDFLAGAAAAAIAGLTGRGNAAGLTTPMRELFIDLSGEVAIGLFPEFGDGAFVFDYARQRIGKLSGEGAGTLAQSGTLDGAGPPVARLSYQAATDTLNIEARSYHRAPIRREAMGATNGAVRLSVEVAYRADVSPQGTILMIYGSGPAPKEAFDFWAFHFLARGWAVVTYDKRGSGQSGGDWHSVGLDVLAQDAASVIAELIRTMRIHKPIGVWGASQAGWVMPQLGAQSLVDFIIMHAGAATTPAQLILDQVVAELKAYGLPQNEIEKARDYYALDTDVSRGRAPWSAIEEAYVAAQAAKADWLLGPPEPANSPNRVFIRLIADFDPARYWRLSRVPLLAIFGGKDVIVPAEPNRTLLRSLLPPATHYTELVLPQSNHLCLIANSGVRAEYAKRTQIDPGYFPAVDAFLSRP